MFERKKKPLDDHDPTTLDLEVLRILHGSLIAKLMLVNAEYQKRMEQLGSLAKDVQGTLPSDVQMFVEKGNTLRGFGLLLQETLKQLHPDHPSGAL